MLHTTPPCRLFVLFARDAPRAVILRRGPARRVRLILWHLDTDTFEPGQWFKGRIYEDHCDLSPDGSYFAYYAADYRSCQRDRPCTWMAVSRPPYLTAISFWPQTGSWMGQAWFSNNRTLYLTINPAADVTASADPERRWPSWFRVYNGHGKPEQRREEQSPWVCVQPLIRERPGGAWSDVIAQAGVWERSHPGGAARLRKTRGQVGGRSWRANDIYRLHLPHREPVALDAEQADFDSRGRLVVARAGQVWVQGVVPDMTTLDLRQVADFNGQTFEEIVAPKWATRWGGAPPR